MIKRLLNPSHKDSYFLFGPRGSGKTTFLLQRFPPDQYFWVDLADEETFERYSNKTSLIRDDWLEGRVSVEKKVRNWVIIDEIQLVPRMLNMVQHCIDWHNMRFVLTGSSARKLRAGRANLLGGRAFHYVMHPFNARELCGHFNLDFALQYGMLPRVWNLQDEPERRNDYFKGYVNNYLKEEIIDERIVRDLEPFSKFLEIAAQSNGQVINHERIAQQTGIDTDTVGEYYQILDDTLLGFYLHGYSRSYRAVQATKPKFYFHDAGIVRAILDQLDKELKPRTYAYGDAFEHFVILEIIKTNNINRKGGDFSYLKSRNGKESEIDLIVRRGNEAVHAIEIKSTVSPDADTVQKLATITSRMKNCQPYIFCRAHEPRVSKGVNILPWEEGVRQLFT